MLAWLRLGRLRPSRITSSSLGPYPIGRRCLRVPRQLEAVGEPLAASRSVRRCRSSSTVMCAMIDRCRPSTLSGLPPGHDGCTISVPEVANHLGEGVGLLPDTRRTRENSGSTTSRRGSSDDPSASTRPSPVERPLLTVRGPRGIGDLHEGPDQGSTSSLSRPRRCPGNDDVRSALCTVPSTRVYGRRPTALPKLARRSMRSATGSASVWRGSTRRRWCRRFHKLARSGSRAASRTNRVMPGACEPLVEPGLGIMIRLPIRRCGTSPRRIASYSVFRLTPMRAAASSTVIVRVGAIASAI